MEPILRIKQDIRQAAGQTAAVKDPDAALLFCYVAACGGSCALPPPQQMNMGEARLQKAPGPLGLFKVCARSPGPPPPSGGKSAGLPIPLESPASIA